MKLQFSAEQAEKITVKDLPEPVVHEGVLTIRTDLLVKELIEHRLAGESPEYLARLFHEKLSGMITALCRILRKQLQCNTCALSGGVFQNTLLLESVMKQLEQDGFNVLKHHLVPPNDGGIALGQAAAAMKKLNS